MAKNDDKDIFEVFDGIIEKRRKSLVNACMIKFLGFIIFFALLMEIISRNCY